MRHLVIRTAEFKSRMHAVRAWPAPGALHGRYYCGLPTKPHLRCIGTTSVPAKMEWAMTNEKMSGETMGAKALMFALIAGAALLFLEVTWSPVFQPQQHPTAQTVTVQPQRVAAN